MMAYIMLLLSIPALYLGARLVTEGARHMARVASVPEFVIGSTIVAMGTSLPELASSLTAMASGHPGIVAGNVLGSNIANIGLALGLAGMLYPIYVCRRITDTDIPMLLASAIATLVVFMDMDVGRIEGSILILMYLAFIHHEVSGRQGSDGTEREAPSPRPILGFLLGLLLLYLGARYLISSALEISESLGVSEPVIAFFLVALGTSLPEVATSIVAARDGRDEIAVGNLIGSNVFNSLVVLGTCSFLGSIASDGSFLLFALPAMLAMSILLGFVSLNNTITRLEGALLFLLYTALAAELL